MKKVSLFFTTPVRKKMETSKSFSKKPGIQMAISLPTTLLCAIVGGGFGDNDAKRIAGGLWKYFDGTHQEFHDIEEAAQSSQRMESTVGFSGSEGNLNVDVRFFRKSEKLNSFQVKFSVMLETGHIAVGTYGKGPTYC